MNIPSKDTPLSVSVENEMLIIRIGVDVLKFACERMDANNPFDDDLNDFKQLWKVTDAIEFARDVKRALNDEREDGSTILTDLLDKACLNAVEDGSTACDDVDARTPEGGGDR